MLTYIKRFFWDSEEANSCISIIKLGVSILAICGLVVLFITQFCSNEGRLYYWGTKTAATVDYAQRDSTNKWKVYLLFKDDMGKSQRQYIIHRKLTPEERGEMFDILYLKSDPTILARYHEIHAKTLLFQFLAILTFFLFGIRLIETLYRIYEQNFNEGIVSN